MIVPGEEAGVSVNSMLSFIDICFLLEKHVQCRNLRNGFYVFGGGTFHCFFQYVDKCDTGLKFDKEGLGN